MHRHRGERRRAGSRAVPTSIMLLESPHFRLTQQCSRAGRAQTMERTAAGKELALVRGPGVPGSYIPGNPRVQKLQAPNRPLGLSPQIRLLGTAWGVPTSGLWAPDPVKWLVPFRGQSLKASMGEIIDRLRETGHQSATTSFQRPERRVPAAPRDFPEPGQGREDETGGPRLESTGEVGSGPGTLPFAAS